MNEENELELREEKKEPAATITQDNALISASYRLSLDAKRALLLGISKVDSRKNLWKEGEYAVRIYAHEWREYYGVERGNVYNAMKAGMSDLYEETVKVKETEEEGKEFRWISRKEYKKGEGWIEYSLTREVLIYLNSLYSTFTTFKLLNVGGLRSIYSIRIYELCSQFRSTGWRKMRIDELRGVLGIPEDQHRHFGMFKQRVIVAALKEINEKTDLTVKFELAKKGRKFTHITFYLREKEQLPLDLKEPEGPEPGPTPPDYLLDVPAFGKG